MQDSCDDCIDLRQHENSITDNEGSWSAQELQEAQYELSKMQKAHDDRNIWH